MAAENLKSPSVTNLDAQPIVMPTVGEGADGALRAATENVTSTAAATSPSTYKMVRIPTNAKVKKVLLNNAAHGTSAAFDIDVAHSDSTTDGTPASLQGTIVQISAADNKLFGAAVACASANVQKDITFQNTFTVAHQNLPLWQVLVNLGATTFTADPGGFFDIVVKSTATDTSGGMIQIEVDYVQ